MNNLVQLIFFNMQNIESNSNNIFRTKFRHILIGAILMAVGLVVLIVLIINKYYTFF